MSCICGHQLRISEALSESRCACPVCGRRFIASFAQDPEAGRRVLSPVYLEDSVRAGSTYLAEVQTPPRGKVRPEKGAAPPGAPPEPPDSIAFACLCGGRLLARRRSFDARARCPICKARLRLTLVYDSASKAYEIRPLRLIDPESGDTLLLPRG